MLEFGRSPLGLWHHAALLRLVTDGALTVRDIVQRPVRVGDAPHNFEARRADGVVSRRQLSCQRLGEELGGIRVPEVVRVLGGVALTAKVPYPRPAIQTLQTKGEYMIIQTCL